MNELNFARFEARFNAFEARLDAMSERFDAGWNALDERFEARLNQRTAELRQEMQVGFAEVRQEISQRRRPDEVVVRDLGWRRGGGRRAGRCPAVAVAR